MRMGVRVGDFSIVGQAFRRFLYLYCVAAPPKYGKVGRGWVRGCVGVWVMCFSRDGRRGEEGQTVRLVNF